MKLEHQRLKIAHWLNRLAKFFARYEQPVGWKVGDVVQDDLTLTLAKVVGIEWADGQVRDSKNRKVKYYGCVAIWLDNDYLDGGRHPWEVSEPIPPEQIPQWDAALDKYRKKREDIRFSKQPKN